MEKINRYYLLLIFLAILYVALLLATPPNDSVLTRYSLSASQARILSLTFAIPLIAIWATAFFGLVRFKEYTSHVKTSSDGKCLTKISQGLTYLALGLPINSIGSSLSNIISAHNPGLRPVTMIINNYIALVLLLMGFYLISRGAEGLVLLLKRQVPNIRRNRIAIIFFLIISLLYSYLTLKNSARQFEVSTGSGAAYYMADFPLVVTIIIPYLYVWFLGIRAADSIYTYSTQVKGVVYKEALSSLATGLALVVITSMLIRYLVSLTTLLNSLSLKVLLLILYMLIFVIFAGYLIIAKGAKKLQRIEEV